MKHVKLLCGGLSAVILAFGLLLVSAATAPSTLAHAEPERMEPPNNGRVPTAPAIVEVWFTEEVSPDDLLLTVRNADGAVVDLGDTALDLFDPERKHVTVSLRPGLPAGNYVVQWHTQSAEDGDGADGFLSFFVEQGPAANASPVAGASPVAVASPVAAAASPIAVTPTPVISVAQVPGDPDNPVEDPATADNDFDSRAFGLAVLVGIGVAVLLFLFWRLVRPKPGERPPQS